MATGKKSFVAYADWKEVFDELPNEDAGALIKHIFAYVNDENPKSESVLINAVFANIKNTLKRDLDKWENQLEQRRSAGKKSAELRATKSSERSISFNETTRNPTDNVSVSVSDNVIDKERNKRFQFFSELQGLGISKSLCDEWNQVRKSKKLTNSLTAFNRIKNEIELSQLPAERCIEICVEKSWGGFSHEWVKEYKINNEGKQEVKLSGADEYARNVMNKLKALQNDSE